MFGVSSVIDLKNCNPILFNREQIRHFVEELLEQINMKIYNRHFHLEYYGHPSVEGWTGICMLDMSSMTFHTTKDGRFYLDLFSCREYNLDVVVETAQKYFNGIVCNARLIERK